MSDAIRSKDLSYNKQEPAFLRRLRGQFDSDGRQNVQIPRPQKARLQTSGQDDDDGPVMLDETGREVGREEWKAMEGSVTEKGDSGVHHDIANEGSVNTNDFRTDGAAQIDNENAAAQARIQQQAAAEIGVPKKRRIAKVVGIDEETSKDAKVSTQTSGEMKESTSASSVDAKTNESSLKPKDASTDTKLKKVKPRKKIKLSFDEPEGD